MQLAFTLAFFLGISVSRLVEFAAALRAILDPR
jgi:hypothetical protein